MSGPLSVHGLFRPADTWRVSRDSVLDTFELGPFPSGGDFFEDVHVRHGIQLLSTSGHCAQTANVNPQRFLERLVLNRKEHSHGKPLKGQTFVFDTFLDQACNMGRIATGNSKPESFASKGESVMAVKNLPLVDGAILKRRHERLADDRATRKEPRREEGNISNRIQEKRSRRDLADIDGVSGEDLDRDRGSQEELEYSSFSDRLDSEYEIEPEKEAEMTSYKSFSANVIKNANLNLSEPNLKIRLKKPSSEEEFSSFCRAMQGNMSTVHLDLDEAFLGDSHCSHLKDMLLFNRSLTTLELNRNFIGDVGAELLALGLRSKTKIRELYLRDNMIGRAGIEKLESIADAKGMLIKLQGNTGWTSTSSIKRARSSSLLNRFPDNGHVSPAQVVRPTRKKYSNLHHADTGAGQVPSRVGGRNQINFSGGASNVFSEEEDEGWSGALIQQRDIPLRRKDRARPSSSSSLSLSDFVSRRKKHPQNLEAWLIARSDEMIFQGECEARLGAPMRRVEMSPEGGSPENSLDEERTEFQCDADLSLNPMPRHSACRSATPTQVPEANTSRQALPQPDVSGYSGQRCWTDTKLPPPNGLRTWKSWSLVNDSANPTTSLELAVASCTKLRDLWGRFAQDQHVSFQSRCELKTIKAWLKCSKSRSRIADGQTFAWSLAHLLSQVEAPDRSYTLSRHEGGDRNEGGEKFAISLELHVAALEWLLETEVVRNISDRSPSQSDLQESVRIELDLECRKNINMQSELEGDVSESGWPLWLSPERFLVRMMRSFLRLLKAHPEACSAGVLAKVSKIAAADGASCTVAEVPALSVWHLMVHLVDRAQVENRVRFGYWDLLNASALYTVMNSSGVEGAPKKLADSDAEIVELTWHAVMTSVALFCFDSRSGLVLPGSDVISPNWLLVNSLIDMQPFKPRGNHQWLRLLTRRILQLSSCWSVTNGKTSLSLWKSLSNPPVCHSDHCLHGGDDNPIGNWVKIGNSLSELPESAEGKDSCCLLLLKVAKATLARELGANANKLSILLKWMNLMRSSPERIGWVDELNGPSGQEAHERALSRLRHEAALGLILMKAFPEHIVSLSRRLEGLLDFEQSSDEARKVVLDAFFTATRIQLEGGCGGAVSIVSTLVGFISTLANALYSGITVGKSGAHRSRLSQLEMVASSALQRFVSDLLASTANHVRNSAFIVAVLGSTPAASLGVSSHASSNAPSPGVGLLALLRICPALPASVAHWIIKAINRVGKLCLPVPVSPFIENSLGALGDSDQWVEAPPPLESMKDEPFVATKVSHEMVGALSSIFNIFDSKAPNTFSSGTSLGAKSLRKEIAHQLVSCAAVATAVVVWNGRENMPRYFSPQSFFNVARCVRDGRDAESRQFHSLYYHRFLKSCPGLFFCEAKPALCLLNSWILCMFDWENSFQEKFTLQLRVAAYQRYLYTEMGGVECQMVWSLVDLIPESSNCSFSGRAASLSRFLSSVSKAHVERKLNPLLLESVLRYSFHNIGLVIDKCSEQLTPECFREYHSLVIPLLHTIFTTLPATVAEAAPGESSFLAGQVAERLVTKASKRLPDTNLNSLLFSALVIPLGYAFVRERSILGDASGSFSIAVFAQIISIACSLDPEKILPAVSSMLADRRVDMLRRQVLCSWVHSVLFVPTVADVASLSVARKMCCALDVLRSLFDIEGKGPTGPIAEFVLVLPALVSAASTQLYAAHFIHVKLRVYGLFCEILSLLQMSELEECCHLTLRSLQLSAFHDWITTVQTTNALTDAEVHPDLPFPEVAMGTLGVSDHMQHHALALGVSSHALSVRKEILPELPLSNTEQRELMYALQSVSMEVIGNVATLHHSIRDCTIASVLPHLHHLVANPKLESTIKPSFLKLLHKLGLACRGDFQYYSAVRGLL